MASCCGSASKMSARAARIIYAFFYFLAGLLALLLKYFGSKLFVDFIIQVGCVDPDNNSTSPTTISPIIPNSGQSYVLPCAGSQAVYRISFGTLCFFFVCGIVSGIIKQFHQGWWFIKILLFIVALVFPFFLPAFILEGYQQSARWFAGIFLIFQMLTYIACAYNMHESIMEKSEKFTEKQSDPDAKCACINIWAVLYLFLCLAGCAGIIAGLVLMYINFPCFLPNFMTSVTLVIAAMVIILCLMSRFSRGMLTGVVVACYTTYLCWSALTSNPDNTIINNATNSSCNPFLCDPTNEENNCDVGSMIVGILFTIVSISYAGYSLGDTVSREDGSEKEDESGDKKKSLTINDDTHSVTDASTPLARDLNADGTVNKQAKLDALEAARDEAEEDADAESEEENSCCGCGMNANVRNLLFQLVMCLASFYLAMLLTNWATYDQSNVAGVGLASMWIKFVSQWLTVALFLWTLMAPICCPNRSFD